MGRWVLVLSTLLLSGVLGPLASAQRTGSSFGGGSFSTGGASSGASDSDWSTSDSTYEPIPPYNPGYESPSYENSTTGYGSSTSSADAGFSSTAGLCTLFGGLACMGAIIYFATRRKSPKVYLASLQLGVDWRARRELQATLERLGAAGITSSPAGLCYLLQETVHALRRAELSWLYAAVGDHRPTSAEAAESTFRQLGVRARSRFQEELLRNADGAKITRDASPVRPHPTEGEGVAVVTVLVAANREITKPAEGEEAAKINALLDALLAVSNPATLVALEVIWSPSAEEDRMSTAELETLYPELRKLDEQAIAGRVFCRYCSGPFAAELLECPHCGAPLEKTTGRADLNGP